jgi:hypothetical protein
MAPEFHASKQASMADLLAGSKEGWRLNQEGERFRSPLDPTLLVAHFRRIGARFSALPHPEHGWLRVNCGSLLPVLWLALRERGWTIDRQDAEDAWFFASLTPAPVDEGGDPF